MIKSRDCKIEATEAELSQLKNFKRLGNTTILDVFTNKEQQSCTKVPIWIMRQAGRYLPEFREIRKKYKFFELLENPNLCSYVTLMPIKKFNLDAAIIFSDILVLSNCLGIKFEMIEGIGPVCNNSVKCFEQIGMMNFELDLKTKLYTVYESIALTRKELANKCPLIGFTAAPWTLAAYMISGSSKNQFSEAVKMFEEDNKKFETFLINIKSLIVQHLFNQALYGCEILQVFDSHFGILNDKELLQSFIIDINNRLAIDVKSKFAEYDMHVPLILFPGNCDYSVYEILKSSEYDCISIHHSKDLSQAQKILSNKIVQGNLDPAILRDSTEETLRCEIRKVYKNCILEKVIANLGHGIDKSTPEENVAHFVDEVHKLKM
ncbi:MAG: hypothetical protein MHMPM18_000945 [Marteilia pararefringens]